MGYEPKIPRSPTKLTGNDQGCVSDLPFPVNYERAKLNLFMRRRMASQGERVLGVVDMCCSVLDPMAQDETPMQDIPIPMQEQSLPQTNSEPGMGAESAVAYDTSPSLLRNPPRSLPKLLTQAHPTWPSYSPCWRK